MATNVQKTPLALALNRHSINRTLNLEQTQARELPCSVAHVVSSKIVTVKWEILDPLRPYTMPPVTMPVVGSQYLREPIQVGCKGMAVAADAYLGAMSGLGSGIATLNRQPNLSTHVFVPFGHAALPAVDLNTLVLYGEANGVLIEDRVNSPAATITLTHTQIVLACGGHSITISASGVVVDGKTFLTHEHTGVQAGGSNTGPVA